MKKTLFVLAVLCSFFANGAIPPSETKVAHEFYVSVTQLEIDETGGTINAVFSTFPDDWERAMNALLEPEGRRYLALDSAARETLHARYLAQQWHLSQPGVDFEMVYYFSQQDAEKVEVFVSFRPKGNETIDLSKKLTIDHRVLADLFPSQENIVTVFYGKKRKTNSCREGNNYKIEFTF